MKLRTGGWHFLDNSTGASAIEFAIVAPLFFGLVFSAFEMGVVYMRIATIDLAMTDVARQIYTGQAQEGAMTRDEVIDALCDQIQTIVKCKRSDGSSLGNVMVEVLTLPAYSSQVSSDPTCFHEGEDPGDEALPTFSDTIGGDIVYVRFCVTNDIIIPGLGDLTLKGGKFALDLPESASGKYAIVSSVVFRNEPFSTSAN
ncbi:MAG: TadE/TadG family type IV pilus assembly protein [bacterium]